MGVNTPVWIAWETQRRTLELSKQFNCSTFVHETRSKSKFSRYCAAALATIHFIFKSKPYLVFCQNPSLVCCFVLCIIKPIFRFKLVVDRHSNFRFNIPHTMVTSFFNIISDYTIRHADLTIVTNNYLKQHYIEGKGGTGVVLPDKIPNMATDKTFSTDAAHNVLFITSFSLDEPVDEVFEAIRSLPDEYFFYISGDYKKYDPSMEPVGKNYQLTGFLDDLTFKALLNSVEAVMVFTKNEYTLTCGAYEGVAAVKPLILSNTETIKNYFDRGAVYCEMNPVSIMTGILECFKRYDDLIRDVELLQLTLNDRWQSQFNEVCKRLGI